MKRIAFFCIPAHGHTNPMLPVAKELVKQGHRVRFYSFNQFAIESKIPEQNLFLVIDSYLH